MGDLIWQRLLVPRLLTDAHVRGEFQCGHASLDQWLLRRALMNQATGSSRTYVVTTHGELVVGYYSIAPTSLEPADAVGALRRNSPSPIPMYLLGRLAVDQRWCGQGIGAALLLHARARAIESAWIVGGKGLLCHALDAHAKSFYASQGFVASPTLPLLMMAQLPHPTSSPPPPSS